MATNGCDGLAVTFGDGAGFRLNCGRAADDPVKQYGLYDVKWATPFKTKTEALRAIEEAIWTYNHRRLHEKLGYKTPSQFRAEWTEKVA